MSPLFKNVTTEGVVLSLISFGIISIVPFLNIDTHEYVVPKSIPRAYYSSEKSSINCLKK